MQRHISKTDACLSYLGTKEGLCTVAGAIVLTSMTNVNIVHAGGYLTPDAPLIAGMSLGIFAASRALGGASKMGRVLPALMVGTILFCEAYNFEATSESTVATRDAVAAPLRAKQAKHDDAVNRLRKLEDGSTSTERVKIARSALEAAKADRETLRVSNARKAVTKANDEVVEESRNGCRTVCQQKQRAADAAQAELTAALQAASDERRAAITAAEGELRSALQDAATGHAAALAAARADVEANPAPPSSSPLADRLNWAAWALDLLVAGLRSSGASGLACVLIAFGARRRSEEVSSGQTDFEVSQGSLNNLRLMLGPDDPDNGNRRGDGPPDRPKRPAPTGGLSKDEAFDDLTKRLADGETIPSDAKLAKDWNRPKQTVHVWMKGWRGIGLIPAPTQVGRCKQTASA